MKQFDSVEAILDFAMEREDEAASFYLRLAGSMDDRWMKAVFEDFAREEKGHKAKLEQIKAGRLVLTSSASVPDLRIGDYLVDVESTETLDYQRALVLAMKREKASFKLYTNLADRVDDEGLADTFRFLAQEEAKHKLRFEVEYDDLVLREN
jgi:rubrerythrin